MGAVWALTGGHHDTTALCARDSEFVRMSRGAFEVLAQQNPRATSNMLEGMARRISAASSARNKRWALPHTASLQAGLIWHPLHCIVRHQPANWCCSQLSMLAV